MAEFLANDIPVSAVQDEEIVYPRLTKPVEGETREEFKRRVFIWLFPDG